MNYAGSKANGKEKASPEFDYLEAKAILLVRKEPGSNCKGEQMYLLFVSGQVQCHLKAKHTKLKFIKKEIGDPSLLYHTSTTKPSAENSTLSCRTHAKCKIEKEDEFLTLS